MTGVGGEGEASLLLPPCPAQTASTVLAELIDNPEAVAASLQTHGPAAVRRRWTRAVTLPVLAGVVILAVGVPVWVWVLWALSLGCACLLAADRARSLGHLVRDGWLVARTGSLERRRDHLDTAGIIGWTVRQTYFQRRAGVATLIAATAAGEKRYQVLDVPAQHAWSVAVAATPWVADNVWAPGRAGPELR